MSRQGFVRALIVLLAIGLVGCQGKADAAVTHEPVFAPEISVSQTTQDYAFTGVDGAPITFAVKLDVPKLIGVSKRVATDFSAAVKGIHAQYFEDLGNVVEMGSTDELSCSDRLECVIPMTFEVAEAGVLDDFGSVTLVAAVLLGTTSSSYSSYSVTMNLRDGSAPELAEFIDFTAPATERAVMAQLRSSQETSGCGGEAADYFSEVPAWSVSESGIVFTWTPMNSRIANACGVVSATLPWLEEAVTDTDIDEGNAVAEKLVIPGCETMNPLAQQERNDFVGSWGSGLDDRSGRTSLDTFNEYAGPTAQEAMNSAEVQQGCFWLLYVHGNNLTQYTAELDEKARDLLIEGLRDSDYVESSRGAATVFSYSIEDSAKARMVGTTEIHYVFIGNAWLALFDTGASDYTQSALDALLAANPRL